jgi:hypothetical protein
VIEAFSEPDHANRDGVPGSMGHRSQFIPPYLRIKARKGARGTLGEGSGRSKLLLLD